eukprot:475928-Pyramimonas_sp.AAC.2
MLASKNTELERLQRDAERERERAMKAEKVTPLWTPSEPNSDPLWTAPGPYMDPLYTLHGPNPV